MNEEWKNFYNNCWMFNGMLLEVVNISKYFGGLAAVNNFSFNIDEGEIVGLIGPNGAGKTTTLNMIAGFYNPTSGKIKFEGKDITKFNAHKVCRLGIARTFQIVRVFPEVNVFEHVMIGAIAREGIRANKESLKQRVTEVLEFVGLMKKKDVLAKNLTAADKKRLELASALATRPKLLLLDELAAGLNPTEIDETLTLLKEINKMGVTLLVVEHVMRFVMGLSERIIVMHHGEKIAEGSPSVVATDKKVIESYLGEEYSIA
jgi:branched-chain amino acid transport system ATP-binding protein